MSGVPEPSIDLAHTNVWMRCMDSRLQSLEAIGTRHDLQGMLGTLREKRVNIIQWVQVSVSFRDAMICINGIQKENPEIMLWPRGWTSGEFRREFRRHSRGLRILR